MLYSREQVLANQVQVIRLLPAAGD
jgi:hypothetical protein